MLRLDATVAVNATPFFSSWPVFSGLTMTFDPRPSPTTMTAEAGMGDLNMHDAAVCCLTVNYDGRSGR